MISARKNSIVANLEKISSNAAKYGASSTEVSGLNAEIDNIKNLAALDLYKNIDSIPEINAFNAAKNAKIVAEIINSKGKVSVYDKNIGGLIDAGHLGIVDSNGLAVLNPDVKQGYNEYSNVLIQNEFLAVKPVVRNFEANRQIFLIESSNLQKVISQLGSN